MQKLCLEKMVDDYIHNGEMESSPTVLGIDIALVEHGMEHMLAEVWSMEYVHAEYIMVWESAVWVTPGIPR